MPNENFVIGKSLQIDEKVIAKINELDNKINQIATDSDTMAKKFNNAIGSMSSSASDLISKLTQIQSIINRLGIVNTNGISSVKEGLAGTATQAEKAADEITDAAGAMNRFGASKRNIAELTELIKKINDELKTMPGQSSTREKELVELRGAYREELKLLNQTEKQKQDISEKSSQKRMAQLEREAIALERWARQQATSQAKLDSSMRRSNYQSYVTSTEGSLRTADRATNYNQRAQAIKNIEAAIKNLRTTDANYQKDLSRLSAAHKQLVAQNKQVEQSFRNVANSQSHLMNISQQLGRQLALIFSVSQIKGYVEELIKVRGEFELQNTALASILGNKQQADLLFKQITELAVQSPFTIKELTTYTKSLSAYQVEYEKLYDTTRMLADVSAGLGVDMQRLILAFGQVKAANYLRGTETRQFTEAGINMLGELAKYYSELEGRIVSVSEVQDRQFKRMISFQDVEEVFKRLTSEGGMFFEMQERQADTLAGMMSNMKDSFDLMFNSIGESNQGLLKGFISIIKSMVDNWRIFANLLEASAIGFGVYTAALVKSMIQTKAFSAANVEASITQKGLQGAILKTSNAIKGLGTAMMNHPFAVLAAAVAALGLAIYDHYQKVQKAREEYDKFGDATYETEKKVESLRNRIEFATKQIEEQTKALNEAKKGTDAYRIAQEKLTEAQKDASDVISTLQREYPDLYKSISTGGATPDANNAAKVLATYQKILQDAQTINAALKEQEGWFNEGLSKDLDDLSQAHKEYASSYKDLETTYNVVIGRINQLTRANDDFAKRYGSSINSIINSTDTYDKRLENLLVVLRSSQGLAGNNYKLINMTASALSDYNRYSQNYQTSIEEAERETQALIDEMLRAANVDTEEAFKNLPVAAKQQAAAAVKEVSKGFAAINDEFIQRFVNNQLNIHVGVILDWGGNEEKQLDVVQERINNYLKSRDFNLVPQITADKSSENYFSSLKSSYKDLEKEAKQYATATQQIDPVRTNQKALNDTQAKMEQIVQTLKDWGQWEEKTTKKSSSGENARIKELREQVRLLQNAKSSYEEYRKVYSADEANQLVAKDYERAFSNVHLSTDMNFDATGVIEVLENIWKKFGTDGKKIIDEVLAPLKKEQTIKVREENIDKVKQDFDELFGDYEMTIQLDDYGIDKNIVGDALNINFTSIDDLKNFYKEYENEFKKYGNDGIELAKDIQKRIADYEQKALEDRTKKYVEYLKRQYSEIATISIQLQKDIAEVNMLNFSDTQKQSIIQRLQDEANKKIQNQTWDDFKSSDVYTQMFDDLSNISTKGIDYMIERLEEMKDNLNGLDPTNIKEVIKAINDLKEEQIERNPLKGLGSDIKDAFEFAKQRKELEEQITAEREKQKELTEQMHQQEINVDNASRNYGDAVSKYGKDSTQAENAKKSLNEQEEILSKIKDDLKESEENAEKLNNQYNKGATAARNLATRMLELSSYIDQTIDSLQTLVDGLNSTFNLSDGFNDTMDSLIDFGKNMSTTVGSAGKAAAAFATQDYFTGITQSISAVGGLFSAIGSLFTIKDKKKEREIQKEIKLVDNLKDKYEELEEAIDDAYSLETLKESTDNAIENLEEQNKHYQEMINAEEDKKKTDSDRIKEWQKAIEENNKQIKQLEEEMISQVTGGAFDDLISAAESFTQAWLEAFKETGDGLSGLKSNFNDFIESILVRQASMMITSEFMKKWQNELSKYISEDDLELTVDEAKRWADYVKQTLPALSESLENYLGTLADKNVIDDESDAEMSGLQKGIQSITEETAQALEALLNSIRFFSADSNEQLHTIVNTLITPTEDNPYLIELQNHTRLLGNISGVLNALTMVDRYGKRGLKVFML